MIELQFPVAKNPWDGQDYLVLMDAPEFSKQAGITLENMRIVGLNRNRQYVQFTLPKKDWEQAEKKTMTFRETDVPRSAVITPGAGLVAGSRLLNPWRVSFTVIGDFVAMYVRSFGSTTHYTLHGVHADGRPDEMLVPHHIFNGGKAKLFVEVEANYAPVARAPDAPALS